MGNLLDKLLEKQGLNYENLNAEEKETYNKANFSIQKLTVEDVARYVTSMKNSIALQLVNLAELDEDSFAEAEHELFLKARLKNYILMEAFLLAPAKAEEALGKSFDSMKDSETWHEL